ncbi:MAG TPA: vanadium-dependent haloperoxidase [Stellaceae bacterium]|nr:vanadium-dependent haloperoxidase [Stellaceae bacterium]
MKTLLLAATAAAVLTGANPAPAMADATEPVSQVVQWNRTLLVIVRTPGAQPATIHPTRSFAIMHAAIYDAVNAIDGTHKPYLVRLSASHFASQEAAAAAAAHEVLVKLYPSFQATLDTQFQQALAQLPKGGQADGINIGNTVADRILALRANDGSNNPPARYVFGNAPGDYQSTPPNFPPQPQFTSWSRVTPFALEAADQFRPGGPPKLTSDRYTDAFEQVKSLGIAGSTTASADEALTGRFWNGAIQNYWNEIAQTAALAHDLKTGENARLFALLNLSFADGVIAFYDAKYTYNFWRPVTAIRAAATDGNPDTDADPNWLPEVGNTTPDPSYPGAHAVISAAGAEVLISFFHKRHFEFDVTSEVLPGVVRSFTSFPAAADEATLSRIFAGVHFLFDLTTGQRLGSDVADFVVDNFLTSRNRDD